MTLDEMRRLAHESISLSEMPYTRHQPAGKFKLWRGVGFTASSAPGAGFNFASVLVPGTPPLAEVVAEADAFFPGGYGVQVEGDAGHPCEAELQSAGWTVFEDETAMVLPEIGEQPAPPPGFEAVEVRDAAALAEQNRAAAAFFGAGEELFEQVFPKAACLGDPDMASFAGRVGGEIVAVGALVRVGRTAMVAGIATRADVRRRGYGAAITRAVLRAGRERGCTSASLRATPDSQPLYESVGFTAVCQHRTYVKAT